LLTLVAVVGMGITEPMFSVPVGWFCIVAATAATGASSHSAGASPRRVFA
jgi:hypothetical protein